MDIKINYNILYPALGIFIVVVFFFVLNTPHFQFRAQGIVEDVRPDGITLRTSKGESVQLETTGFEVGESVDVIVYKRRLTGHISYRFFEIERIR